ncbi:MAG TPA: phosphonoacetaldehyde reductase [Candidatus Hydrogenedentes bacterium]|nr:phosphonoacetaldehyde reductase [Candidatus Hydrogenedentota bacterium]
MKQLVHNGLEGAGAFLSGFIRCVGRGPILLVCKPNSFRASGAQDWLRQADRTSFHVFSEFSPNPKDCEVALGVDRFRAVHAAGILAIGGGSVIDMAKLINFLGTRKIGLDVALRNQWADSVPLCPLLAIPTTAGSGSEATHFAVVYQGQVKYSLASESLRPSHALLVPEWTYSLPPYQTACVGMDALAQGVESHWAKGATEESRGYARRAIELALENLFAAVNRPDPQNRAAMLEAAHLAGRAIDISKTTAAHAFAYVLSMRFELPHGHAVALLLPFLVGHHMRQGISVPGVDEHGIQRLIRDIGLECHLPMGAADLSRLLLENVNLERLNNNPTAVSGDLVQVIAGELSRDRHE